ncbi:Ubiquitin carboxyl-terminal hydrolase ZUFSP [Colletotrichum fructicola Nara gc5]|uniref:Ubiquitin carboxyl-terminal hydrolase ZUFSP n=1 Tax=Colletotrichum fructicola (strain Nara gc5) TaxID=1213859 RepID=A0A7J6JG44_COLFN|nr:Ubiquitin carboxyl-terminal hydrolase ZUFSP [Colletotrichum fructicola]KAF4489050.1 Ubiquitin carboxyl-terminal hydrolase ZUFSP [Colletotrichum fructicola Nara gc5]
MRTLRKRSQLSCCPRLDGEFPKILLRATLPPLFVSSSTTIIEPSSIAWRNIKSINLASFLRFSFDPFISFSEFDSMTNTMICPFCGIAGGGEYEMLTHMESFHPEEDQASSSQAAQEQYAECPIEGCGEVLSIAEMDYHVDLHVEEQRQGVGDPSENQTADGTASSRMTTEVGAVSSSSHAGSGSAGDTQRAVIQQWGQLLSMPQPKEKVATGDKRLGKAELGKYAHEQTMPDWLVSLLHKGGEVTSDGVINVLEQLLRQSRSTEYAYLCHPAVQHVSKLKKEGGFCGYRNIQMMVSYINGANAYGRDQFRGRLPTIFEIQEYIENAWDMGINAQGRVETGGIKGTRKYIGTPEAQALFVSLQIPCTAQGFKDAEPGRSEAKLMYAVEQYFKHGMQSPPAKVTCTELPPIYFQHAGHSLTIVGFERQKNGPSNLLVFDPMFRDPPALAQLIGQTFKHRSADESLKPYRRGSKYLRRYREFEILRLDGSQLSPPQSSR